MIGNSLIIQVAVAGVAIGIVVTYIQPTFADIKNTQDEIVQTKKELEEVTKVNSRLTELVANVNAIPQRDRLALGIFLPDTVDEVKVLKDLSIISEKAGVLVTELSYQGLADKTFSKDTQGGAVEHSFSLGLISPYQKFKELLVLFEKNNYPLDIRNVEIAPDEGGQLKINLGIVTYSLKE